MIPPRSSHSISPVSPSSEIDLRRTAAYDYDLPAELIAQAPAPRRDASRLMVLRGTSIEHRTFRDFPTLLGPGELLVINETRVLKARLFGTREGGGRVEVLLLHPKDAPSGQAGARRWEVLVRPGRRLRVGTRIAFGASRATIVAAGPEGTRTLEFDADVDVEALIETSGVVPLPPYIRRAPPDAEERYQTVFARVPGSVAAPTASLHFTPEILEELRGRGVEIVPIVLDVGLGTFRPVTSERLDEHVMHAERFEIPAASASAIVRAKSEGRRIVAAGTTVVRALEGAAAEGSLKAGSATTSLFITPGYEFRVVDALLTNFHLPRSTLLALVAAFAGYRRTMAAYREAVRERYRFFSFGDAMFITERG
jgi:S-adenosylmethionine:tRNA ribosyltransferase-isomerase